MQIYQVQYAYILILERALKLYAAFVCWSSNDGRIWIRSLLLNGISTFVQLLVVMCFGSQQGMFFSIELEDIWEAMCVCAFV